MASRNIPKGDKARIDKLAVVARVLSEGGGGYFSITKLTSLKSLCKEPEIANQFVFFLAQRIQAKMEATPRSDYVNVSDWNLYQTLVAETVTAMSHYLKDPSSQNLQVLQKLQSRVSRTQNEYRKVGWNTVRTIHSGEVLLVEYALECMILPELAPDYAYRVGREYTERYDPRLRNRSYSSLSTYAGRYCSILACLLRFVRKTYGQEKTITRPKTKTEKTEEETKAAPG